ncbi:MAG: hypothetical protein ACREHC_03750, partial [Candidatus Levyibacteriota bacterium]
TGGIAKAEFNIPGVREIMGRSGRPLHIELKPPGYSTGAEIIIEATDGPQHYRADANIISKMMRVFVLNENESGERHPDLYPKRLVEASVPWFTNQGIPIDSMLANFSSSYDGRPNLNYRQYNEYLEGLGKDIITDADRYDAIRHTWEGRIMTDLGFTVPMFVIDVRAGTEGIISAKFEKSKD